MTVNGKYTILGGGSLTIGSTGVVNTSSTGTLDARKSTTIDHGGRLNLSSTAGVWVPQDKFSVGNGSTLHFDVFGGDVSTITGSTVNLGLHGTGSIISLDALNTGVGTYDLITGIQNIEWFNGGTNVNDREFGVENVTNLGAGLAYDIFYDHTGGEGARKISLVITTVPEPSSSALLGLGGLALILRRRK